MYPSIFASPSFPIASNEGATGLIDASGKPANASIGDTMLQSRTHA